MRSRARTSRQIHARARAQAHTHTHTHLLGSCKQTERAPNSQRHLQTNRACAQLTEVPAKKQSVRPTHRGTCKQTECAPNSQRCLQTNRACAQLTEVPANKQSVRPTHRYLQTNRACAQLTEVPAAQDGQHKHPRAHAHARAPALAPWLTWKRPAQRPGCPARNQGPQLPGAVLQHLVQQHLCLRDLSRVDLRMSRGSRRAQGVCLQVGVRVLALGVAHAAAVCASGTARVCARLHVSGGAPAYKCECTPVGARVRARHLDKGVTHGSMRTALVEQGLAHGSMRTALLAHGLTNAPPVMRYPPTPDQPLLDSRHSVTTDYQPTMTCHSHSQQQQRPPHRLTRHQVCQYLPARLHTQAFV